MSVELRLFRVQHSNNVNSALRLKGVRSQESGVRSQKKNEEEGRNEKEEGKRRRKKKKEEVKTCSSPSFIINSCLTPLGCYKF
ncbi:hypothetical protein VB638_06460 [Dolichospermum sp. UHCC 0684]|uniref:hypothetical protein n=1 Tax=unclassified Dolichospermum TaxID=2622029 RepID=UPI0014482088|nr:MULTISPECIES: hypothetical protein [unclassified Dolichospermum]MEA5529233.1 hypothetical protein [Dolichospermum sp. UHCC 0684]MTJ35334.1 hypothetical protein [Dolichospermum sp. UHCC 0260]